MGIQLRASRFGNKINFVSPMPLETCAYELSTTSEEGRQWFRFDIPTIVRINKNAHDHYRFSLHKTNAGLFFIRVTGELERIDANSTRVIGHGAISPLIYLIILAGVVLEVVIIANSLANIEWGSTILLAILIVVLWATSVSTRDYLIKTVYDALDPMPIS